MNVRKDWNSDDWLNQTQKDHLDGTVDIYKPIEAYREQWVHEVAKDGSFLRAYPVEGSRVRMDLPPIVNQWKHSFNRSLKNV